MKRTKLTAWFTLNSSDEQFLYTWSDNKWKRRKRNHKVVTRLYHVSPRDVERYHLHILLLNVPAATSFDDLLSYEGVVCSSFQESCKLRHLIHDDSVWERTIEEASVAGSPYHLRQMFSFMLLNCDISDPPAFYKIAQNPLRIIVCQVLTITLLQHHLTHTILFYGKTCMTP